MDIITKFLSATGRKTKAYSLCLLFLLTAWQSFGQSCNCPPVTECGACVDGISSLRLKYNGFLPALVTITDNQAIRFAGVVLLGGTFTVESNHPSGKFVGSRLTISIEGLPHTSINIDCEDPVYANSTYGLFTVISGESKSGGALCCSQEDMEIVPPVILNCPSNINASLGSGCSTIVHWTAPSTADNCGDVTLTSSHAPGSSFPRGTTTVTYTATDDYNNVTTCSFNVVVTDNTKPIISGCPANIITTTNATCQAVVNWAEPTATDNCATVTLTRSHAPGAVFNKGTTPVTYTATDASGNVSTCTFNVIVEDKTAPVITACPSDITVSANALCKASVTWTPPTATDNCTTVTLTSTHNSGHQFSVGTTVVSYTATDAVGNKSTCTFNVVVKDETPPVITGCPSDITLTANALCKATGTWSAPTGSDNCGAVTMTTTHASGTLFSLGTTPVTYTATDGSGNKTTCTFNVIVKDETPPIIAGCPTNITVAADPTCKATVTWTPPSATDNCNNVSMASTHAPGSVFSMGTTTVTYTATDHAGNKSTCSFNVLVKDQTPPVITGCPSDITLTANAACKASGTWSVPVATDNCTTITLSSTHAPGAIFSLGTTTITYTATDGAGNKSTCSFNVVVKDDIKPAVIQPITSDIQALATESGKASVTWPAPSGTDNCSAVSVSSTHNPGTLFPIGTTLVTYTITDVANNKSYNTFNVIVKDEIAPLITGCINDITLTANATCAARANWTHPIATDNSGNVTVTRSHNPGTYFPLGTTTVVYIAKDASGNTSTCSFNIIVEDKTKPVIIGCPSTITATANASCEAMVNWTAPTASDNCSVTMTSTHQPGTVYPIGTTQVKYTATDGSGNSSTCSFNVIVEDNLAPVVTGCPTDIVIDANTACAASVSWAEPAVVDCEPVITTQSHHPGDIFAIGETIVTYTFKDESENLSSCTFKVVVKDHLAPVFTNCPNDITVDSDQTCSATAIWNEPQALDNCNTVVSITSSHSPGETFPIGITQVIYTATDAAGNTAVCEFNVIVRNKTAPVLSGCPPADINVEADDSGQALVDWMPPTATTDCGTVTLTSSHEPGYFPVGSTLVEYQAIDDAGTMVTCSFRVHVSYGMVSVAQVVTPDGNGVNDDWILSNIEKYKTNRVTVVDRWGSVIFTAVGYNNDNVVWKGQNQEGGMVPTGTYYYTLSVEMGKNRIEKQGFIELIR
ncbi:MAG TPA: HYR domain-containing protein [Ohtaekwangia sp.]|nr:HYR domain-containing protein [Ohtaekwangia sp.]